MSVPFPVVVEVIKIIRAAFDAATAGDATPEQLEIVAAATDAKIDKAIAKLDAAGGIEEAENAE